MSTREAQRHLSQLLDEIDREESAVLIVRYGRPAAMLIPFEETGQAIKLPRISELSMGSNEDPAELEENIDLDADQQHVLLDIARCADVGWRMDRLYQDRSRPGALLAALTRLELARLVECRFGGAILTRKGRGVAARLDSTG